MDMITAEEVVRRINFYFDGGAISRAPSLDRREHLMTAVD
jgi:hypothetical protein